MGDITANYYLGSMKFLSPVYLGKCLSGRREWSAKPLLYVVCSNHTLPSNIKYFRGIQHVKRG